MSIHYRSVDGLKWETPDHYRGAAAARPLPSRTVSADCFAVVG